MPTSVDDIDEIAGQILRYLALRPNAADSLEGVIRWWLPRLRQEEVTANVKRALDRLVAEGIVQQSILSDGRTVYAVPAPPAGDSRPS